MSKDERFSAPWKDFVRVLGYDDKGLDDPMGFRPHEMVNASPKDVLLDLYIPRRWVVGQSKDSLPTDEIMHLIYREVLNPKVGNLDEIHGYLVDLMLRTMKGKGVSIDVSDYLWNEIFNDVVNRKPPPCVPYIIMKFISIKWAGLPFFLFLFVVFGFLFFLLL